MAKNLDKEGLSSIVDNYQLFYIDLWGVVHNGVSLHKEAVNVLREISKKGKEYILLTNAPRPNSVVKTFLKKMGMEEEIRNHVFTSGEASLNYLRKNLINKFFFHIGPPRDFDLFNDFKNDQSKDLNESHYLLCTGLFDHHDQDLNYYKNYLTLGKSPAVSVTHVKTYDDSDNATTMENTKYYVDSGREPARIVLRTGESFPTALRVANAIEVEYVAGYSSIYSIPEPIRMGILQHIAHLYEHRGDMYEAKLAYPPMLKSLYSAYVVHKGLGSSTLMSVG